MFFSAPQRDGNARFQHFRTRRYWTDFQGQPLLSTRRVRRRSARLECARVIKYDASLWLFLISYRREAEDDRAGAKTSETLTDAGRAVLEVNRFSSACRMRRRRFNYNSCSPDADKFYGIARCSRR